MELSNRLQAVADMVTPGLPVADVGCDHGYIPIYLVQNGISPHVTAMDINEGPLERARENICRQQGELPIELILSDGLRALRPGEVESVIVAGMGGGLVMKILEDSMEVVRELKECILQPQSEIYKVRAFLLEKGFLVISENMICEDGKYYPMMKVRFEGEYVSRNRKWSETELRFGKLLLSEQNPVLYQFMEKELEIKQRVLSGLADRRGEKIVERISQLNEEIRCIQEGIAYYK
ncbi:tRNA (adenine(22)-N(1))-methyltransferase [Hespellia stercorisuis]|uniref:tRNA (Adenine22-N1)-methyltransferase n=1 Tax=Hespellia stercorisuis DSM 15480 TaxID=1121950 RepID=A0A1M6LWD1_9FIRM|nr:class I SAM-dependent methyltransferase [Hespellia stercorisuis]SHJ75486.1 tRNA (adenine22-N1)-methyltransferase [Hespellia stercorisuis DSM 15480]